MIRVIHKAFDILEYLAKEPRQRKKLNEISGHFRMNASTCANILKTMVQHKFVDQTDPRGGYMLGPMIYYLSRTSAYRGDLITAAEPLMASLVKKINETVLLAILRGNERFIVLQIDGNQHIQVNRDMFFNDNIYDTATGRLLLAHSNEKELDACLAVHGLPGARWPEVKSIKKLKSAFENIRRHGYTFYRPNENLIGIAYPISEAPRGPDSKRSGRGIFAEPCDLSAEAFQAKGEAKDAILSCHSSFGATEDPPCGSLLRRSSFGYGGREPQGFLAKKGENGRVIAALGLFLPAFRFKGAHKTAIMKGMSTTAAAISERLSENVNYKK